ncbi:hypothetical protein B0H10DRAFT_1952854 [Mycena sp. CBHHK59/15]|nr:hypothetical protein B0H10DRAFT_1952854 [Mycena sp. CBHHK59/15]
MADKRRIPECFKKNTPRFDEEKPEELPQFLEDMERMMELEQTPAGQKNAFITRYALQKPAEHWRRFESFTKVYEEFKKEIIENYPVVKDYARGSLRKLTRLLKGFTDGEIDIQEQDDLMKLVREMNVEVTKLLKAPPLITERDTVQKFFSKLDSAFVEHILHRLDQRKLVNPQAVPVGPDVRYTFKQVTNEAKLLAREHDEDDDYFLPNKERSIRNATVDSVMVKQENREHEHRNLEALEGIKQTVSKGTTSGDGAILQIPSRESCSSSGPAGIASAA